MDVRVVPDGSALASSQFHPKLYLVERPGELITLSGSANLTGVDVQRGAVRGGLQARTGRLVGQLAASRTRQAPGYIAITNDDWWDFQLRQRDGADRALLWRPKHQPVPGAGRRWRDVPPRQGPVGSRGVPRRPWILHLPRRLRGGGRGRCIPALVEARMSKYSALRRQLEHEPGASVEMTLLRSTGSLAASQPRRVAIRPGGQTSGREVMSRLRRSSQPLLSRSA